MATKSKFFVVAVEGATATDGRVIEAAWINDIVATYNRATYGARVNMEHIRGFSADGPFKAYGDVLAVRKETIELSIGGKMEKRLALAAEIEPTDELVAFTKAKQKIYTSIEIEPNFANTGKVGLIGLACTDSPASLGTDILKFSASNDPSAAAIKLMFDSRKTSPTSCFTAAHETNIVFEDAASPAEAEQSVLRIFASIGDKIMASMGGKPVTPPATPANEQTGQVDLAAIGKLFSESMVEVGKVVAEASKANAAAVEKISTDFTTLKAELEAAPSKFTPRPLAGGGDNRVLTDC